MKLENDEIQEHLFNEYCKKIKENEFQTASNISATYSIRFYLYLTN